MSNIIKLTPLEVEIIETFRKMTEADELTIRKLKGEIEGQIHWGRRWLVKRSDVKYEAETHKNSSATA